MITRQSLVEALAKPDPIDRDDIGDGEHFDPWNDVIKGIDGTYLSACDDVFIASLIAVRDQTTFQFLAKYELAGHLVLYTLSGHDLIDYGSSPHGGWPAFLLADLWDSLIEKWQAYSAVRWARSSNPLL